LWKLLSHTAVFVQELDFGPTIPPHNHEQPRAALSIAQTYHRAVISVTAEESLSAVNQYSTIRRRLSSLNALYRQKRLRDPRKDPAIAAAWERVVTQVDRAIILLEHHGALTRGEVA
jgi:hypothetical protein